MKKTIKNPSLRLITISGVDIITQSPGTYEGGIIGAGGDAPGGMGGAAPTRYGYDDED